MTTTITRVTGIPPSSVTATGKPAATPSVTTGFHRFASAPPPTKRGGHLRLVR